MAGDKSLKDLAGAVVTIAEHQRVIKTDVKDIRDAICNPSGILDAVNAINERLDKAEKKARLEKLRGRGGRTSELNARNLLKNTDNISNNLAKILKNTDKMAGDKKSTSMGRTLDRILDQVRRISGRRGEEGSRRLRLTGDDLKRDNKKMKELQSISRSVDIMERLRGLKLRDFMFTKRKLKKINGIISIICSRTSRTRRKWMVHWRLLTSPLNLYRNSRRSLSQLVLPRLVRGDLKNCTLEVRRTKERVVFSICSGRYQSQVM